MTASMGSQLTDLAVLQRNFDSARVIPALVDPLGITRAVSIDPHDYSNVSCCSALKNLD